MLAIFQELKASFLALLPMVLLALFIDFFAPFMTQELLIRWLMGALFVFLGLFLFLRGVQHCLLPLGEMLGTRLPFSPRLWVLIAITFVIGVAANSADPAISVLVGLVKSASAGSSPPSFLVALFVVIGTGLLLSLGTLRILLGLSPALTLGIAYSSAVVLACFVPPNFLSLAFDSGGVAIGPLTLPFLLSLGMGLSSVLSNQQDGSDGFGLLGLVALGPVYGIMLLGFFWS